MLQPVPLLARLSERYGLSTITRTSPSAAQRAVRVSVITRTSPSAAQRAVRVGWRAAVKVAGREHLDRGAVLVAAAAAAAAAADIDEDLLLCRGAGQVFYYWKRLLGTILPQ